MPTITYRCGHTGSVNSRDTWKAKSDCYDCHIAAKRDAENETAAAKSADLSLPELTGSDKQIAWATTIRLQAVEAMAGYADSIRNHSKMPQAAKDAVAMIGDAQLPRLLAHTEAKWWVDNRDDLSKSALAKSLEDECHPALVAHWPEYAAADQAAIDKANAGADSEIAYITGHIAKVVLRKGVGPEFDIAALRSRINELRYTRWYNNPRVTDAAKRVADLHVALIEREIELTADDDKRWEAGHRNGTVRTGGKVATMADWDAEAPARAKRDRDLAQTLAKAKKEDLEAGA